MGSRIGDILVRAGACTPEAVREALQNQVIFGGRLGTNLLEIGSVTEEALAKALGARHRLPSLSGDLPLDPRALALVTPEVADRYDVVPYFLAEQRLAMLVCDPSNLTMLDEVAFLTGKQVHPIVVPEARIWALLRRAYGIERQLRGIDVEWAKLGRPASGAAGGAASAPARAPGGELVSEADFEALYGARPAPASAPPAAPPRTPAARTTPPRAPAPPARAPAPPTAVPPRAAPPPAGAAPARPPAAPPRAAAAPPAPPAAPEEDGVVDLTDLLVESPLEAGVPELSAEAFQPLGAPLANAPAAILETIARAPGHAPPTHFVPGPVAAAEEPEATPLGFDEAIRALQGVDERGEIANTVLRYARSKFRRAVLLTVNRSGVAQGWAGLGEGLRADAVARVRIPLGAPGIVDTVVATRAHYLGPIPKTEANVRLLKQLGGGVPGNAFLVPILALGRVANVFYADNGRGAVVDASDLGELLILATRIAQSYDTLLRRAA